VFSIQCSVFSVQYSVFNRSPKNQITHYNIRMSQDRKFFWAVTALVLLLVTVPFWLAARAGGEGHVFSGLLLNPIDGYTYLAKMYQGWQGNWRARLPFTAQPGPGAYIFTYYLFLGHLARLLRLSLPLTFTLARVFGALVMLLALHGFFARTLPNARTRRLAFALAALGSGMGWLLVPAGAFTSDFWVAETYPFLSAYDNPHFPLGLALTLWLITPDPAGRPSSSGRAPRAGYRGPARLLASLLLGLVSPFGVVIVCVVLGGLAAWEAWARLRQGRRGFAGQHFTRLVWVLAGGAPVLLYDWIAIRSDPVLAAWDAQNLTPSPPLWDLLVSLSPALLLAVVAVPATFRRDTPSRTLLVWAALGLLLIAVPFNLQRRFLTGLYVPLAGLAALAVERLGRARRRLLLAALVFTLALPTNLIVLLAGQQGAARRDPRVFLLPGEAAALNWIASQTPPEALILAAPDTGLLIPAYTGRRVIYGHPFETVNAPAEEQTVTQFFQGMPPQQAAALIASRGVDYVFYGPRERALGALPDLPGLRRVYDSDGVQIFVVSSVSRLPSAR